MNSLKNRKVGNLSLSQFAENLASLLPRLMCNLIREERNYFTRGIITLPQLHVLQHLAEHGSCTMQELARGLGVRSSSVTGLMDRLVTLRLVHRLNSPTDRRIVLAAITPKGRGILDTLYRERRKSIVRAFRNVSPRARADYLATLKSIVGQVSETHDPS